MDIAFVVTRAVQLAAQLSAAGTIGFVAVVATPAYAASGRSLPAELRRWLAIDASASLALTLLSAVPWLAVVAHIMSGAPIRAVFAHGVIDVVLTQTDFGQVWILRMILAIALVPCAVLLGRRRGLDVLGVMLGAAQVAATAWQGHANGDEGIQAVYHLSADVAHFIAAAAWLGALLPLALLLNALIKDKDPDATTIAGRATRRFSVMGLVCVATLLLSGTVNAWFLVGTVAALFGTLYGQLLMAKIAIFLVMIGIAATNRARLSPRIAAGVEERKPASDKATAQIARNAMIEAALGLAIIAIVAVLGTLVPGAHQQPRWPFPYRLGFDNFVAVPALLREELGTAALTLVGLTLIFIGWRWRYTIAIVTGATLFIGIGWRPIELFLVDATPTTYDASPEPFAASSIIAGGRVYVRNCVACHGVNGHGDGPLAAQSPIPPANLTAHLFAHTDGDLYWFVTHGMAGGAMPGFGAALDAKQRWDVINYLKVRAEGAQAHAMSAMVTAAPEPLAPDFAFPAADGAPGSLKAVLAQNTVLLVFDSAADTLRHTELAQWRNVLTEMGVTILEFDDVPELRAVYAAFALHHGMGSPHIEFLIDSDGYIRARWSPGDLPDWENLQVLVNQISVMDRIKLAAPPRAAHVH